MTARRTQADAEASEARFRHLMDTAPVLIWSSDAEKACVYLNKVWLDFTGRTMAQQQHHGWADGVHPDDYDRCLAVYIDHFDRRAPFRMEHRLLRRDGAWRWLLDTGVPRYDANGVFEGFIGSCLDITDIKEAEAQRQHDLEEKAALLRELHHRVKNNAQVFASLLTVQAGRTGDEAVRQALRTAASRAAVMTIAQEQMHEAGEAAEFDLGGYVNRLVTGLDVPEGDRVTILVDCPEPVLVPVTTAVPLGLVVNELLTNALRHAFPDGRAGRVSVVLWREPDGGLSVSVADDGVGLLVQPEPRGSAGTTIVKVLTRQLGAALAVAVGPGTRVTLTLPAQP